MYYQPSHEWVCTVNNRSCHNQEEDEERVFFLHRKQVVCHGYNTVYYQPSHEWVCIVNNRSCHNQEEDEERVFFVHRKQVVCVKDAGCKTLVVP